MDLPLERVQFEVLREMLSFGLNMARMGRLSHDRVTQTQAKNHAHKALAEYHRFRSGLALPLAEHIELVQLALELSRELLPADGDPEE